METYYKVLIVDDDDDDFLLMQDAFHELKMEHHLEHKKDGSELIDYLKYLKERCLALPDLIILDINMPKIDGIKALTWLKNQKEFCHIPVIIYTTSSSIEQNRNCMQLGAQAFVSKCQEYSKLLCFVQGLDDFIRHTEKCALLLAERNVN